MKILQKTYIDVACSKCKRTDRKNHAKGLCRVCYSGLWNKKQREKLKKQKDKTSYTQC